MKPKLLLNLDHIFYYLQNFQKKSEFILYQPIKLYFINLEGKLLLINLFERFPFIWYSSLARLWMFLWWIMENDFFEAVHEMNLCCHYIQFVVSDWCFYSIIYHETFKLVGSSQTGIQYRISLGVPFVLESCNLTTLLKQTISYQPFYINLKRIC